MNCRDIQADLAFYGEAELSETAVEAIESHLASCGVCRERRSANLSLRADLSSLIREVPPADLSRALKYKLRGEIRNGIRRVSWFATDAGEWFQRRIMPYAVGAMVTLVVGFATLSSMLTGFRENVANTIENTPVRSPFEGVMIASNRSPYSDDQLISPISPAEYAILRRDVSTESPSLNPQGTLISLSSSFVERSDARDEDGVVVVADVLTNGFARIQEIVDPTANRRVLIDLERAFETELGAAPFVPAEMDNRLGSIRVVVRFQSVDVPSDSR